MSAIMEIHSFHGAASGPFPGATTTTVVSAITPESKLNVRYKRADNDAFDTANPIQIPSVGVNYSWRKFTLLYCVTLAGRAWIANVRWYAYPEPGKPDPGSLIPAPETQPVMWYNQVALYAYTGTDVYTQPAASNETAKHANMVDVNTLDGSKTLAVWTAFAATWASLVPNPDGTTGGNPIPVIGADASYGFQNFVVSQMGVKAGCTPGIKTPRTVAYRYDEV